MTSIHDIVYLCAPLSVLCACAGGDKVEETGDTTCGGYGTLNMSVVAADEYTESIQEHLDGVMILYLSHLLEAADTCEGYGVIDHDVVDVWHHSVPDAKNVTVMEGQYCGRTEGYVSLSDQPGYDNDCGGNLDLTELSRCGRTEATITVTCHLNEEPEQG